MAGGACGRSVSAARKPLAGEGRRKKKEERRKKIEGQLTEMSVLVIIAIVQAVLLELMRVVAGRGGQMTSGEAQTDGGPLRWSPRPGAAQW
jgi:hypothetical protein